MREWKGNNLSPFEGQARHSIEAQSIQLHELSRAVRTLMENKLPARQSVSNQRLRAGASASGLIQLPDILPDGRYGDILVSSPGYTDLAVLSMANIHVCPLGTDLQPFIDGLGLGAIVILEKGDYYAYNATPTTPLTITSSHYNLRIRGMGQDYSVIKSPVLIETGTIGLEDLWVYPPNAAYCCKIFKSGSFLARCSMRRVRFGATQYSSTDKPTVGLQLDGAGLLLAEQVLCAFNAGDGLLVDSTAAEPNTTLKFDMCSFVLNEGWGAKVLGSCSIAEFNGGNSEQNDDGELHASGMNGIRLVGMDFESTGTFDNQVFIENTTPSEIMGCNFLSINGNQDRALYVEGSGYCNIDGNRFVGYGSVGAVRIGPTVNQCRWGTNALDRTVGEPWIEDYSRP